MQVFRYYSCNANTDIYFTADEYKINNRSR